LAGAPSLRTSRKRTGKTTVVVIGFFHCTRMDRPDTDAPRLTEDPDRPAISAGTLIGPYRIEDRLGEGGMGEVYRARDARLKRDVAVKVLPSSFAHDIDRRALSPGSGAPGHAQSPAHRGCLRSRRRRRPALRMRRSGTSLPRSMAPVSLIFSHTRTGIRISRQRNVGSPLRPINRLSRCSSRNPVLC
jgi:serine/threonine protein kinase